MLREEAVKLTLGTSVLYLNIDKHYIRIHECTVFAIRFEIEQDIASMFHNMNVIKFDLINTYTGEEMNNTCFEDVFTNQKELLEAGIHRLQEYVDSYSNAIQNMKLKQDEVVYDG